MVSGRSTILTVMEVEQWDAAGVGGRVKMGWMTRNIGHAEEEGRIARAMSLSNRKGPGHDAQEGGFTSEAHFIPL